MKIGRTRGDALDQSRWSARAYTTIRSFATMISLLMYFATGSRQSVMLSIVGVRCDRTSVLTPASCAMRPSCSAMPAIR